MLWSQHAVRTAMRGVIVDLAAYSLTLPGACGSRAEVVSSSW
jgi:hypothetical protein